MTPQQNTKTLTVGSLFSGVGGLDLGLERAGLRVMWQSENNPYASRVLTKHWSETPNYGDIKTIDWHNVERPNIICGGYPCQPFSQTGQRAGHQDERHLFPWMLDAISTLRPDYAIMENVKGHLSLGGLTVIAELAAIGYVSEWCVIPAAALGAPHKRERLVIVSYPYSVELGQQRSTEDPRPTDCRRVFDGAREAIDGIGQWWQTQPQLDRVANGVPHRVDRLRGLGNAVVPQLGELIGKLILQHHTANNHDTPT